MKTIEIQIYQFDELSDDAKQVARNWFREASMQDEWWQSTYEDAEQAGLKLTSFDLDRNRHACGKFIESARECAELIVKNHGEKCDTFTTAQNFLKERDEIVNAAPKDENGELENECELDGKLDDCESEFLRAILRDYSVMLQNEYEYQNSDECVADNIRANEYDFLASGKRA